MTDAALREAISVMKATAPLYFHGHSILCPAYTSPPSASIGRFSKSPCTCGFTAKDEGQRVWEAWAAQFESTPTGSLLLEDSQCCVTYQAGGPDYGFSVFWKRGQRPTLPESPCFIREWLLPELENLLR